MSAVGVMGCRVPGHADLFKKWDKLIHALVREDIWRLKLWFDYDDLLNHARQALWRAHETYDPNNGANFQTYARRVVKNALNGLHHYSRTNMRRDKGRSVSLDDVGLYLHDGSVPADAMLIADEEASVVRGAIGALCRRDRIVIMGRLVAERSLDSIGAELGLTKERVRQIERSALARIYSSLSSSFPGERVEKPSLRIRTGRLPRA